MGLPLVREFTHNLPLCELSLFAHMSDIILQSITPCHFFETVKLLKTTPHRIYITVDSIEVRFHMDNAEKVDETNKRYDQLEHFMLFIEELVNSSVPTDLDEFIRTYRKTPKQSFYRHRSNR